MLILFVLLLSNYNGKSLGHNTHVCEEYCSREYLHSFTRSYCDLGCRLNFEIEDSHNKTHRGDICQTACVFDDQIPESEIACSDGCNFDAFLLTDNNGFVENDYMFIRSWDKMMSLFSTSLDKIKSAVCSTFFNNKSEENSHSDSMIPIRLIPYGSISTDDQEMKNEDIDKTVNDSGYEKASINSNMSQGFLLMFSSPSVIASITISALLIILILASCIQCSHTRHQRISRFEFSTSETPAYSEKFSINFVQNAPYVFVKDDENASIVSFAFA